MKELEARARQLRKDTYARLTPTQRLAVARHPNRPTFLDIALNISDKFVELHGDRAGLDDPAMVCGLASMDGVSFMFIGHQKGRNTKENIYRNFGMPQPNGYRKALRFMRHADHFGFPIVTFVDTPGAFAGKSAEESGQGEAIAVNLREMFGFRVPILSVVIGEGGSGGALANGCANHNLIMEHSVYYVASPEACAAILWKSRDKAGTATEALRITSSELVKFGVMDEIVPEPLGAAHADPMAAFPAIKKAILDVYRGKYERMSADEIRLDRYAKFRKLGMFEEFLVAGGKWREARAARAAAPGAKTKAGTWAPTEDEAALVEILIEPKNALIKQYHKLFAMEGVELEVRPSALQAIAKKALKRKTGARGLRSILESVLLDTMYELPTLDSVSKVVIDESTIESGAQPLMIYADQPKVSGSN